MRAWPALLVSGAPDELFAAALTDFVVTAIDEPSPDTQRLFFHDPTERDRALAALRTDFPALRFDPIDVDDEDWAARSQASLKAITVGDIVVAPPWDVGPTPGVDSEAQTESTPGVGPRPTTIIIQPSMGFGTGHHATTRLCLAALQRANVRGRSVIDVGTGSGVLAIAASVLGASPVAGIDDDPDAIQSARENLDLNPVARVDLRTGDLRTSTLGTADVVVANLTGTLLVQTAPLLTALVAPAGRLILSGVMLQEEAGVTGAFADLRLLDRTREDEWCCLVFARDDAFR